MAREALGIAGAAVGSYFGPVGASIGYAIGSGIGGYLDPTVIPAPGMAEAPIQTSREGVHRPIPWGLCHTHGNIVQKTDEWIVTKKERQGKGGSTKVETKRRFRTFAIRITVGPIAGVTRVWENERLVYDARTTPAIDPAESAKWLEGTRFYLGTSDQLPDPDLEADTGVGECPAYRGTALMVRVAMDLTDFGGTIPQYRFEINGSADGSVTSRPYPIEAVDGIDPLPAPVEWFDIGVPIEGTDAGVSLMSWQVRDILHEHAMKEEGVDVGLSLQSWEVRDIRHYHAPKEEGTDTGIALQSWTVEDKLVPHSIAPEGTDTGIALLSWTVSQP